MLCLSIEDWTCHFFHGVCYETASKMPTTCHCFHDSFGMFREADTSGHGRNPGKAILHRRTLGCKHGASQECVAISEPFSIKHQVVCNYSLCRSNVPLPSRFGFMGSYRCVKVRMPKHPIIISGLTGAGYWRGVGYEIVSILGGELVLHVDHLCRS